MHDRATMLALPFELTGRRPATRVLVGLLVAALVAGCDSGNATPPANGDPVAGAPAGAAAANPSQPIPDPSSGTPTVELPSAEPSTTATVAPIAPAAPAMTPLAVVTGFDNYTLNAISLSSLSARLADGKVLVPCGADDALATALGLASSGWAPCVQADSLASLLGRTSKGLGLLPPGLVGPGVKAIPLDGADLFGEGPARSKAYPLVIPAPDGWTADWTAYDPADIRVVLSTGVNCPDRGVSLQTNVLGKGWDWLLDAGTVRYTGRHWNPAFGWWVVDAVRTGNLGAVKRLIANADIAVSDFECPMTSSFVHHASGTSFTIDPKVAALMKEAGFDIVTLASDHMTNAGLGGVTQTVGFFDKQGIRHVGAGKNISDAMKPAVITVRGLRFGFVGLNGAGGSVAATAVHPGTAPLTSNTIKSSVAAARKVADIVIVMPQWSTQEYVAPLTSRQLTWRDQIYAAGADHIIGGDNHWAGALSITPGGASGNHMTVGSQGNFWFGQSWSRQTEEGVMTMATFVGTRLVQVRLIPTVVLDNAQPNITNPATDGQFVLKQVLGPSIVKPR